MAEYNLGSAKGRIVVDYDGTGVDRAKEGIEGVGKTSQNTDAQLNKMATGMAVAGAVIAGGFALAVNSASSFEKRMSAISAVSGATGADLEAVRQKALQLGKDTAFSAGEAASAIEELAKAGISLPDIMNGAADATVALAAAGEVDLTTAATIASNAMNQFGLTAQDMTGVVDNIAGAANASAIDVNQFGMSLSQVGAVANLAGVNFEDTATAIALLGNAGIVGSDAGTSLKTMLNNLQPVTDKQIGLFKDLGLMTAEGANQFYTAEGKLKSLGEVAGILQGSLAGLTDQQKQMALETLFGSDAIRAAAVLADEGAEGFAALAEEMGRTSAAEVAATRMDNLAGSLEEMQGSLETLAIAVGTILIPIIRDLVDRLTELFNWFLSLDEGTQKTIIAVIGVVGGLLLLGATVIKTVMFIKKLHAIFMMLKGLAWLRTFMTFLFGPWGLIILAVAALAFLIWKNWDTIKGWLITAWKAIKTAFSATWDAISAAISLYITIWRTIITTFLTVLLAIWTTIWNAIVATVTTVFEFIKAVITLYVSIWIAIITTAINVIQAIWNAFWGVFGALVKAVWELIVAVINLQIALVMFAIRTFLNVLMIIWKAIWNGIVLVATTVWNTIKAVIFAVLNFLRPYIEAALNFIKSVIVTVWNAVSSVTSAVWNAIKGIVSAAWNALAGFVSAGVGRVKAIISGLAVIARVIGGYFADAFNAARGKVEELIRFVSGIAGRILSAVGNLGRLLYNAGKDIIQGLIDGVTAMIGKLTDKLKSITKLIPDKKGPPSSDRKLLEENGELIMAGLIRGINSQVPTLERILRGVTTDIPVTVHSAMDLPAPAAAGGGGDTWSIGEVSIPAKDIAEMQSVTEFFDTIRQSARKKVGA